MLNSLVAIAPSSSITCTSNTSKVSALTLGAIKLTSKLSAFVKVTAGPDIARQLTIAIVPSESLAFAVSATFSNS
ncbi:hypothetical protein [uncultured Paraglaciecola sp.]|uniref:hypothetical protein n=1 Tax=uncultured Paraglaciecola sp. TaxID=1765024 RepID=UPI0030D80B0B